MWMQRIRCLEMERGGEEVTESPMHAQNGQPALVVAVYSGHGEVCVCVGEGWGDMLIRV